MAKYKLVPKSLVSFNTDDLSDDTGLISPELLFEDFEYEQGAGMEELISVNLASPEELFGKSYFKEMASKGRSVIKLKSPEELFGKVIKQNGNNKSNKNLSVKKDKKSGK